MFEQSHTPGLKEFLADIKRYVVLRKDLLRIETVEKLTILLATLVMVILAVILSTGALFYILFALAYVLEPWVGGLIPSFSIIAGIYLVLILAVILFRKKLIISPLVGFLSHLFLEDEKND